MENELPDWAVAAAKEVTGEWSVYDHMVRPIARALVDAERRGIERAPKVADEASLADSSLWSPGAEIHAYHDGQEYAARTIAAAIRQIGGER